MNRILFPGFLLATIFSLVSCDHGKPKSVKTKFSCISQDGNLTAAFVSEIYQTIGPPNYVQKVVISNKARNMTKEVLRMDHGYNAKLEWIGDLLQITYPEGAKIIHYTNFIAYDQSVKIHLVYAKSKKGLFVSVKQGCKKDT